MGGSRNRAYVHGTLRPKNYKKNRKNTRKSQNYEPAKMSDVQKNCYV